MPRKTTVKAKPLSGVQISEEFKSDAQRMKENLDSQTKINFLIPLLPGEHEGSYETVCLNGYTLKIKKGALVSLPQQVVEILAEKYKVALEAGKESRIDRSPDVEEALA